MKIDWRRLVQTALVCSIGACGSTHGLHGTDAGNTTDARAGLEDRPVDVTVRVDRAAPTDTGPTSDVSVQPGSCAADNATINACGNEPVDRLVVYSAFFNGRECVLVDGPCVGPDCFKYHGAGLPSEAVSVCEAANAECDPIKCSRTGGIVRDGCATRCGVDQGFCLQTVCDCGPGKTFISGQCVVDAACTRADFCRATGGNVVAGRSPPLPDAGAGAGAPVPDSVCECPSEKRFIEGRGCIAMQLSDPCVGDECLCTNSGGRWLREACAEVRCGVGGPRGCESEGCSCPPDKIWDDRLGCIDSFDCKTLERPLGAECNTDGDCEDSLACCTSCGARPCARTCQRRVCQPGAAVAMCPPPPP